MVILGSSIYIWTMSTGVGEENSSSSSSLARSRELSESSPIYSMGYSLYALIISYLFCLVSYSSCILDSLFLRLTSTLYLALCQSFITVIGFPNVPASDSSSESILLGLRKRLVIVTESLSLWFKWNSLT